jgi:hypothetical protein
MADQNLKKSDKIQKNRAKKKKTTVIPKKSRTISYGSNVVAIEVLIETLFALGRLEKVDSARVEICRLLARAVDEHPENANLWRQYREAEDVLRQVGANDVEDFNEVLASIWRDAALRDGKESET